MAIYNEPEEFDGSLDEDHGLQGLVAESLIDVLVEYRDILSDAWAFENKLHSVREYLDGSNEFSFKLGKAHGQVESMFMTLTGRPMNDVDRRRFGILMGFQNELRVRARSNGSVAILLDSDIRERVESLL